MQLTRFLVPLLLSHVPHIALASEGVELSISGQDIRLTPVEESLAIEELGPETDDGQLRLPLGASLGLRGHQALSSPGGVASRYGHARAEADHRVRATTGAPR